MSQTTHVRRRKILVVEDQAELLELLRLHFQQEGFAAATAADGAEAVKKARALQPDLILLDVMLPELDGFAVCEVLRRDPATAAIPIIMMTGLTGQLCRYAGMESGATDFVTKPASPAALVSKVKQLLQQRAPQPAAALAENG